MLAAFFITECPRLFAVSTVVRHGLLSTKVEVWLIQTLHHAPMTHGMLLEGSDTYVAACDMLLRSPTPVGD